MSVFPETKSPIRTRRTSAVSPRPGHSSGPIRLALPISKFRRAATRMTVSIGVAVAAALLAAPVAPVSSASAMDPPPDRTALILGGTTAPTPDDVYIDIVKNQYIAPTYPGQDIDYVAVTTPEVWPITGAFRLLGAATGDPRIFGPGTAAWPDEPLWKLSGLFDLTADQSLRAGADDLMKAIAAHGDGPLVIYGLSQGAGVANEGKRRLAAQYPAGTEAPDIDFVLSGEPNLPNEGPDTRDTRRGAVVLARLGMITTSLTLVAFGPSQPGRSQAGLFRS
jgi:PE-PPE domain